ncbi:MAG: AAA family ATPase [Thiomicrospira sp.]
MIEQLKTQINQWLKPQGPYSQTQLAREMGMSPAVLNQFMQDKYKGNLEEASRKISQWLNQQEQKAQVSGNLPSAPVYVPTPTSQRIIATLTYAQLANDFIVVYGGAGFGKTTSIRQYANENPNVWVVEATPARNTGGALLRSIAHECGVRLPRGQIDFLEMALLDRLKNTGGLLVIDEAQFLNDRALESTRRMADMAGIGLALLGNESVYGKLTGTRRAADYAQLFSRIGKRVRLTQCAKGDVEMLCEAWGLGAPETEYAKHIAAQPGALRGLNKALRLAGIFAKGETLGLTHIKAAWADLSGE